MLVGRVQELWRYPVKSMGGESLDRTRLDALGVAGDRGWALRDEDAGEIRGAKKLPALLLCSARYLAEPDDGTIPSAAITLPDGTRTTTDDPDIARRLSALLGRRLTLWPRRSADDRDHHRRGLPDHADMETEMRHVFGREADEPLPDFSVFPAELFEFTSPLGTYFDAFPLHVLTTASLTALGGGERFDRRRFRPNVLIETPPDVRGLVDPTWAGKRLRIGAAELALTVACPRCSMPTQPQPGLAKDPSVLRSIVRDADQALGLYATVATPGAVAVGDPVELC